MLSFKSRSRSGNFEDFVGDHDVYPVYMRVPRKGEYCRLTGLCRTAICELIGGANPRVKSVSVKPGGAATRGTRLVDVRSLLSWIESHAVDGVAGDADTSGDMPGTVVKAAGGGKAGRDGRR